MRGRWLCSPTSPERFYMIRPATLSTSAATGMPKHASKAFQNSARHAPKPSKIEARGGLGSQKDVPHQPSDTQECRRVAQEAPEREQVPPKSGQKPAKWRPGVAPEGPRALQNQARRARRPVFSVIFAESSVRPGLEANFASFSRCALDGRYAFRISFNGVLRTSSLSRRACPRARENFEKQGHWGFQNRPRSARNS